MLEAPWVDCQGVYSCKAIRRPKFVEEAIKLAVPKDTKNNNDADDNNNNQEQVRRVSTSLLDEDSDQGPVPEAFGEYMRIQAGGVSQVCLALLCLACRYFLSMPCKRPSIVACILDYFLDS